MAIISISGKKRSGKDTAGKIAQILLSFNKISNEDIIKYLDGGSFDNPKWIIKKWATYLKQIVADLSGCTLEEMEDEDIKNIVIYTKYAFIDNFIDTYLEYETVEEAMNEYEKRKVHYLKHHTREEVAFSLDIAPIDITRRVMLERIGTEVGRYIHSNIWIDYLMNQYKPTGLYRYRGNDLMHRESKIENFYTDTKENIIKYLTENIIINNENGDKIKHELFIQDWFDCYTTEVKSRWIITDTRFFNEAEKVRSVKGLNIRVNRTLYNYDGKNVSFKELQDLIFKDTGENILRDYADTNCKLLSQHKSETELDNYTGFDYYIDNDKPLDMLIHRVREILTKENLI